MQRATDTFSSPIPPAHVHWKLVLRGSPKVAPHGATQKVALVLGSRCGLWRAQAARVQPSAFWDDRQERATQTVSSAVPALLSPTSWNLVSSLRAAVAGIAVALSLALLALRGSLQPPVAHFRHPSQLHGTAALSTPARASSCAAGLAVAAAAAPRAPLASISISQFFHGQSEVICDALAYVNYKILQVRRRLVGRLFLSF
jgi:hypothetical protein